MKRVYRFIALLAIGGLMVLAAGAYALGVVSYERYSGYFAPVWDETGKGIYYIQRDTSGFIWGMGWEHFTPPASSYVNSDAFSLRHVDAVDGTIKVLQTWTDSPLTNRVTKHYRGRIFNTISARVDPTGEAIEFVVRLQIPKVPRSETWTLAGTWQRDIPALTGWQQEWRSPGGISDSVLRDGIEVIALRGREAFPAAIVSVAANGDHKVITHNDDFADLYAGGIPSEKITEHSWRASIEKVRTYKKTRTGLIARHKASGMREGEAMLKATEDMEELGLIPKRPRLVAEAIISVPDDLKAFDIPTDYFAAGLFKDIAEAIAEPGKLVDTSTGGYLKYYDDEVGPRLKAWRQAGNDRFVVRTDGKIYLLEVRRFN